MTVIALVLTLVEKPMTTWTWLNDAEKCDQQPYEERDEATSP